MSQQQKPWYKKPLGMVAAVLLLPFFLIWYAWAKSKWSRNIKIGVSAASLLFVGIAVVTSPKSSEQTAQKPVQSTASSTPAVATQPAAQKPSEPELSYEVLSANKTNKLMKVTVVTSETANDRLIKLNDKLVNQYKSGVTHLFIDYFNDKTVAKDYFDKQLDDSISEAQKDELYIHYIAKMVYNTDTGDKEFTKQGTEQKVLKNY